MSILKKVMAKTDKATKVAVVKKVIKEEENRANEAFIALGKYYYYNMRDEKNDETEFYCVEVDYAEQRLQKAETRLSELMRIDPNVFVTDEGYVCTFSDDYLTTPDEEITAADEIIAEENAQSEEADTEITEEKPAE